MTGAFSHIVDREEGHRFLFVILALALGVRIAALFLLPEQPLPDAEAYRAAAASLRTQGYLDNPFMMPFYPLLIAAVGPGWGQVVADIAFSLGIVWLCWKLAFELFDARAAAVLAGLMAALYPFLVFYAVVGLTETLFAFLVLGAFLSLYKRRILVASILFVLSILTRPSVELFAPVVIAWITVIVHRRGLGDVLRNLAVYAMVYGLLMMPWWMHNDERYGEFVRLNLGSGHVLYSGNNPANETGGGIAGVDFDLQSFPAISDPVERDRALRQAAVSYIRANPKEFLDLAWLKFQRFWRITPFAPEYRGDPLATMAALSFAPVLVLALATLLWQWRRFWYLSPILGWIAYLTLVHMATIGSIRYRFPLEPFFIVLAAPTLARMIDWLPLPALAGRRQEQGERA